MIRRARARGDRRLDAALQGALAGLVGGASMTAAHIALKRAGWLDRTSPEATVAWLGRRTGMRVRSRAAFAFAEQLTHLAYSAAFGAGYGALRRRAPAWVAPGALLGAVVWGANFAGVVPATGIGATPERAPPGQLSGALVAHLVFGLVTALAHSDFTSRPIEPATSDRWRAEQRVG